MYWITGSIGLAFVVLPLAYTNLVLRRALAWTRVDATVFDVNKNKDLVRMTYVVDGRSRNATKAGIDWVSKVGGRARLRYDPQEPFRYQVVRPIGRPIRMVGVLLATASGVFLLWLTTDGSRSDFEVDLPPAVPIIFGLTALGIGSSIAFFQGSRRSWPRADGTITDVHENRHTTTPNSMATVTHTLTYEFVDDIREATRTGTAAMRLPCADVGGTVSVRYDPTHPDRSDISTARARARWWASAVTLIAIGAVLLVLGITDATQDPVYYG